MCNSYKRINQENAFDLVNFYRILRGETHFLTFGYHILF